MGKTVLTIDPPKPPRFVLIIADEIPDPEVIRKYTRRDDICVVVSIKGGDFASQLLLMNSWDVLPKTAIVIVHPAIMPYIVIHLSDVIPQITVVTTEAN